LVANQEPDGRAVGKPSCKCLEAYGEEFGFVKGCDCWSGWPLLTPATAICDSPRVMVLAGNGRPLAQPKPAAHLSR